ncbi:hypothetical protein JTB14_036330 [Gonioctena quinquepunctata]|nr:hypothetical protein JTB14_036330 [Gonioctena quinquepunctata]
MSSRRPPTQDELEAELENLSDFGDEFEPFDDDIGDPNYDTESNSSDSSDGNDQTAGEMRGSMDVDLDENREDVEENSELDICRNCVTKGKSRIGHKLAELGKDRHGRTMRKRCHGYYETLRNGGLSSKDDAKSTKKVNTVCKLYRRCTTDFCLNVSSEITKQNQYIQGFAFESSQYATQAPKDMHLPVTK